ncbi:hypothetical protein GJAV_G00172590 [Gymnothorax javanicus]|nr:hypothetical protein GJAV_G00172590 [Gymnothorax javanicus]
MARSISPVGRALSDTRSGQSVILRLGTKRMLSDTALVILLLLALSSGQTIAGPCSCSCPQSEGLCVSCGSQDLTELPQLPPGTTELHLQDNQLTSIPPGSFDALRGLERLDLTGNPFHCGCNIWYLSTWLQDHRNMSLLEPTCASPPSLENRPIASLDLAYFSTCGKKRPACSALTIVTLPALAALLLLLLWVLRTARRSTILLEVFARHMRFETHSLRSLKPKHRRKRHSVQSEETKFKLEHMEEGDLEAPLLNMEILPQILDVLQKKHNLKFKAP